jgi:hypothetical protein
MYVQHKIEGNSESLWMKAEYNCVICMKFRAKKNVEELTFPATEFCKVSVKLKNNYVNHFVIIKYNLSLLNTF